MAKKLNPLLVEKYDISHKVLNELADLESRHILFSMIDKPKKAQEIAKEVKIPLSTVYKKMQELKKYSLISEKRDISGKGIIKYYQSNIDDVKINVSKFEPSISFNRNPNVKNE